MSELKFYVCRHCGNLIAFARKSGVPVICCGEPMTELSPNSQDASLEKHVPVLTVKDGLAEVAVGSAPHPMSPEHYIEWIAIRTNNGNQRRMLSPSDAPRAQFPLLEGDEVLQVVTSCNLHGLWTK